MDSRTEKVIKLMELLRVDFDIPEEFKTGSPEEEKTPRRSIKDKCGS